MKKVISVILVAVLALGVVGLAACGNNDDASNAKVVASVDDLPGAKIGVQLGTTGDIFASDYEEEGSTIERYSKGADAVMALSSGKIDCVIIDNEPAKAFVAANEDLKILDDPFAVESYAICVAKNNSQLTADINKALSELKADGVVDQIIKNYIGDDTKGTCPYVSPENVDRSKGELHMATNATFEPYEFVGEGGAVDGIDAMLALAICDKLGYSLVIDDMEFDSIITAVTQGKADFGMAGMTVTEERLEEVDFTDSYTTATQVIIVKK